MEVLGEAEGQIRIEDVLPLFPDFVTIDAFKAAICASLEDYNAQIEGLKTEMADSTRIADALRCALESSSYKCRSKRLTVRQAIRSLRLYSAMLVCPLQLCRVGIPTPLVLWQPQGIALAPHNVLHSSQG